jgi:hypothetical protein
MSNVGFGSVSWGFGAYGSGETPLALLSAEPVRDNVVRLTFNQALLFTGTGEPGDASVIDYYDVTAIDGTVGADGFLARKVSPAIATLSDIEGSLGAQIDLIVDRPFSPSPAQYLVSVHNLKSADLTLLQAGSTSASFDGLYRQLPPPMPEHAHGRRDIANPQTLQALGLTGTDVPDQKLLGAYVPDDTGDYARDEGMPSYRKRIFRRCMTRKGAFAHLQNYGLGLIDQIKKLGRASVRETLASDAEAQIRLEPETVDVRCVFVQSRDVPGLFFLKIRAKTTAGETLSDDLPFSTVGG